MTNRKPAEQLKIINDSAALTYNLEKKLFYSNYLLKLSQQHSTPKYIALAYLRMGNYYQYKGIFDSSSKYYNASIREAEINKDTAQLITSLIYNALNMIVLKDYEAMIRTTKRAFNLSIITKDTFQSATSAFNISYAYLESKNISKSRQYLDTSLKYLLMVKNQEDDKVKFAWGLYYFYSGQTYTNEGKFEEAIINLTKSEKINDSLNNILIRKPLYANLVLAYSKNNYLKEAKIYSEKILNYDNAYDENTLIALEFLADYYKKEKDFKSENYYLRRIISSKDSLRSNDIRLINASYEIDRAELKAKQANEIQEENTKNFLIISAIILTGFIIITLVLYNRYKVKKKLSKERYQIKAVFNNFTRFNESRCVAEANARPNQ